MNEIAEGEKGLTHAVAELLDERRQLLVLFCRLAGAGSAEAPQLLERFCQVLIDYTSLWQFEIHDALIRRAHQQPRLMEVLEREQAHILRANEAALAFNDHYDESDGRLDAQALDEHLSHLGERLATRFDAEDRILSVM